MERFEMFLSEAKKQRIKISKDLMYLYLFLITSTFFILFYIDDSLKYLLFIVIIPVFLITFIVDREYRKLISFCFRNKKNKENLMKCLKNESFILKHFKFSYYQTIDKYLEEAFYSLVYKFVFLDKVNIGPWIMEVDKHKTNALAFNEKEILYDNNGEVYQNFIRKINLLPKDLIDIIDSLGIKVEEPNDIMVDNLEHYDNYHLMYHVFGQVQNDSSMLKNGRKHEIIQLGECLIDFYDFPFDDTEYEYPVFELYINVKLPNK